MSHLEALEEVIKYQKEKLAIQEAKILQLEAEVLKAKAEPKIDYLSYLEKQKNCQHEYPQQHGYGLLGTLGQTCNKCGFYNSWNLTNNNPWNKIQPFIGSGSITNDPNIKFTVTNSIPSNYALITNIQPPIIQTGNVQLVPEEQRNRG